LKRFEQGGSLGWFYGNVTEALGWRHADGEGKTMGLAPYGNAAAVEGILDPFCPKFRDGELVEPHDFGPVYIWNDNGAYHWHLDDADKMRPLIDRYGGEQVSAEAQRVLENQVASVVFPWMKREGINQLCCAGGVFLNVRLNQKIRENKVVNRHHIFPNAGDSGLAVGAALYVHRQINPAAEPGGLNHVYWGPQYDNKKIGKVLNERGLSFRFEEDIETFAAKLLSEGKIVGWLQGRMESGPRALGNRSILMSPTKAENKDIINHQVKFREPFRPFCPSMLHEHAEDYLVRSRSEPFMISAFETTKEKREKIPAVVHVDHTLRPQTVKKISNPCFWKLIKAFGDISGEYTLLNTSLNVRGEPIICHPRDAIRCFYDTGMDYLVLGNYVLHK
jgi:carbamoyltransferase